jgi:tetratricopeptide (TPR) repeat protein
MQVDVIDTLEDFAKLSDNWNSVYEFDPEAHFFLSWYWISKELEAARDPWFILAAKPLHTPSTYVAFFPLRLKTKSTKPGVFYNELTALASRRADYTGFICRPEYQEQALSAFAAKVRTFGWALLVLRNLQVSNKRLSYFLKGFPKSEFSTKEARYPSEETVNNHVCPFVKLPETWDAYLDHNVTSSTRQKIRRYLRKVDGNRDLRVQLSNASTIERDVGILLDFWRDQWGSNKGDRLGYLLQSTYLTLLQAFSSDQLFLPVLWNRDKPLGALGSFKDTQKRSLLFWIGGRDRSVEGLPPGFVLHAYSIRYAIEQGFTTYDFLRGNERYKYSFGAEERHIRCIVVGTLDRRNLGGALDRRSLATVLQRTHQLSRAGRYAEAEPGYRQVLEADPSNPGALYGLGQLMMVQKQHGAAENLFRELVTVQPRSAKAWLRLGQSLQAQGEAERAVESYHQVLAVEPMRGDVLQLISKLQSQLSLASPIAANSERLTLA